MFDSLSAHTGPGSGDRARRRLPSPGSLLLCLLLLILGFVAVRLGLRYQRQSQLIHDVEAVGGRVEVTDTSPAWVHGAFVRILGEDRARGFGDIVTVKFFMSDVTDNHLEQLRHVTSLRRLELPYSEIDDSGLQYLSGLDQLEFLDLTGNQVTDAGLQHLSGLAKLESLDLSETQVTDAGLHDLRNLDSLKELLLMDTSVSNEAAESLRRQLPDCDIVTGSLKGFF